MIVLRRRTAVLAVAAISALGTSGTAFAFWQLAISGSGTAVVPGPKLSATADGVTGLYPGAKQTVVVHITNAHAVPYVVTSLAPSLNDLDDACPPSGWTIGVPTNLPTVAPTGTGSVPVEVGLRLNALNGCQSATVKIPFTVTGTLVTGTLVTGTLR